MKKIIAALCLIAVAGTAAYMLTQPDTSDEAIVENEVKATVEPEETVEPDPTPEPEPEKTYTQEEANIFFSIADGSVDNDGSVSEADIDDFIDWLDTHLEEAEELEQAYADMLAEAESVVEEAVEIPAAATTTPSVTTPTVTETPSTSSSALFGGSADFSAALEGKTPEEIAAAQEAIANGNTDLNLQ